MAYFSKFISAVGYKLRCKTSCTDVFPVYGDCMCSSCATNRRKPTHTQQADECIAWAQSGVTDNSGDVTGAVETDENVTFTDDIQATLLSLTDTSYDHTYDDSFQEGSFLGNFLSRPVQIFRYEWDVGNVTPPVFSIEPWKLFLTTPNIMNKIHNFKLLHGTLHVKILVNGSPFHYGRFFVGVRPTRFDNNTGVGTPATNVQIENAYTNAGALKFWQPLKTLYSQRKHVFIDPSTNQPAEIIWPFISAVNYLDTDKQETLDRMGVLEFWEMNTLRHANGATDPVRITVFAHMTDVQLTGLTLQGTIWAQSGVTKKGTKSTSSRAVSVLNKTVAHINKTKPIKPDEYGTGPISSIASSVARGASFFTGIPYIGEFARATEIGAGAINNVAKVFGFSRPSQIEDLSQLKPVPIGKMAVTSGGDPLVKLSLDPKQELCVDPATVGLARVDEMSFLHIAQHETLLNQFLWTISGTGSTGTIQLIFVAPWNTPKYITQGTTFTTQTAVSFVTNPFDYWTGSLRYRIQVVASQFHRGRLLIQYEPDMYMNWSAFETVAAINGQAMNTRYSHVLDISQERDLTFEVNWAQAEPWRPVWKPIINSDHIVTADGPVNVPVLNPTNNEHCYNGALRIFVLNDLAAPDDSANVEVNVFISAGDSFQVAAPNDYLSNMAFMRENVTVGPPTFPPAQSGMSTFLTSNENSSDQSTEYVINGIPQKEDTDALSVFMGETVSSIRSMIKRYNYHRSISWNNKHDQLNYGIYSNELRQKDFPNGPGVYVGNEGSAVTYAAVQTPPVSQPYNICNMTYLRYYCQAYGLYRGGIRWKAIYYSTEALQHMPTKVTRNPINRQVPTEFIISNQICIHSEADAARHSLYAQRMLAQGNVRQNLNGTDVKMIGINPNLEYELPFYFNIRYGELHAPQNPIGPQDQYFSLAMHTHTIDNLSSPIPKFPQFVDTIVSTENWSFDRQFDMYVAGAEDFTFFLFLGCPPTCLTDSLTVTPSQPP